MGRRLLQRSARRLAAAALITLTAVAAPCATARERALLDADWRFSQVDEPSTGDGEPAPASADFDDAGWRTVQLPHDWSIEGAPTPDEPAGSNGGYFPTGIGWYRKQFVTAENWKDQRVTIEFEGVYHRATVWLNGHELGKHAYGYTPFSFDLTPHLKPAGEPNVLAVRVDNSAQPNCRWYSGSGIYRHVWLESISKLHFLKDQHVVACGGLTADPVHVMVDMVLRNDSQGTQTYDIQVELLDPDGKKIATDGHGLQAINANVQSPASYFLPVEKPRLWSPDSPALYTILTRILQQGRLVDELRTPIGIRTVKVTPERGFELNGQSVKLFGGCVHHDNGPLGAAAFDRAETRRVEILKAAGFNAIRTSHNPPSTAFLDACDRLGMLVVDEAFDGWAKPKKDHDYHEDFAANWKADVEAMVRRDRNHPSVVMWSIGNEMSERGEPSGAKIAADLRAAVLALDATRPITAACNSLGRDSMWPRVDPVFASLDVAGYNYELDRIGPDHERLPGRVMQITESFQSEAFAAWDLVQRNPYLIGEFLWTAMDYLGEAGIGRVWEPGERVRQHWEGDHFPWVGAYCGDIDVTGFRKPISYYRNIIWDRGEKLYAAVRVPSPGDGRWQPTLWALPPEIATWTWPGREGQELEVVVYSRCDEVELYLNDKLIGTQPTGRDQQFKAAFRVPYEPGELRVSGINLSDATANSGRTEVEKFTLVTAGEPAKLRLTADRAEFTADGQDLTFVTSEITDAEGRLNPIDIKAKYSVTGPATIAAIGNGRLWDIPPYYANPRAHFEGRALVVLRTTGEPGEITLTAEAEGLAPATIKVTTTAPK